MHIAVVGPIATADIVRLLHPGTPTTALPCGYEGAPLLTTLIEALIARGHTVTAITLSHGMPLQHGRFAHASGPRLDIVYVPMRRRAWRMNGLRLGRIVDLYAFERRGLIEAIRRGGADVVHAHWAYEFALAAIDSGRPHVVTCHDSPMLVAQMTRSRYRRLRVVMARRALREARCVTAVSPYMRDAVESMATVAIGVVPNPIDPAAFALGEHRDSPARAGLQVAMVCNGWGPRKNPEPAIEAFAMLYACRRDARLHLYGHGFGRGQQAERWAAAHGLDAAIEFHGALPHAQLLQALSRHDVLLHPSLEESFGMVVAEAMAMGLPVVVGERSGAVPWVAEGAGLAVDVTRAQAMSAALLELADDPARASALGQAGRARAGRCFSAQQVAASFELLYAKVVAAATEVRADAHVDVQADAQADAADASFATSAAHREMDRHAAS